MDNKKFDAIKEALEKDLVDVQDIKELNELKVKYLGKKGLITELNSEIKNIPNEDKKDFGLKVNELRNQFNEYYEMQKEKLDLEELNKRLENETIDISLPATRINLGAPNILEKLILCNSPYVFKYAGIDTFFLIILLLYFSS